MELKIAFAEKPKDAAVIASEAKQSPSSELGIASAQKPRLAMTLSVALR